MIQSISLAGVWRVCLNDTPVGDMPPPEQAFAGEIQLPATTETAGLGALNPDHRLDRLTAVRRIEGPVWYQREIGIPTDWSGCEISLFVERTKWCCVFLDGRPLGDDPILCAPHQIPLGKLTPGSHRLTLCVDNSRKPAPGDNHQTSEHTQGNWNGLLGLIELRATAQAAIEHIEVTSHLGGTRPPDAFSSTLVNPTRPEAGFHLSDSAPCFRFKIHLTSGDSTSLNGLLSVQAESCNHAGPPHRPAAANVTLANYTNDSVELTLPLGSDARLWDEFYPLSIGSP